MSATRSEPVIASEAKQSSAQKLDCFAPLAMTMKR
jgi:hypothetical protein